MTSQTPAINLKSKYCPFCNLKFHSLKHSTSKECKHCPHKTTLYSYGIALQLPNNIIAFYEKNREEISLQKPLQFTIIHIPLNQFIPDFQHIKQSIKTILNFS